MADDPKTPIPEPSTPTTNGADPDVAPVIPLSREQMVADITERAKAGEFDAAESEADTDPSSPAPSVEDPAKTDDAPAPADGAEDPDKPDEPPTPPQDPKVSKGFAALKKREREIREREQAVKDIEKRVQEFEDVRKTFGLDPRGAIEMLSGQDFDKAWAELVEFVVSDNKPSASAEQRALQKQIDEMKAGQEKAEKEKQTALQEQARNEAIQSHVEAVEQTLESAPELAPFLHATGSFGLVTQRALQYSEDTGEPAPPITQLVKEVEADFAKEAVPLLEKLLLVESAKEVARRILGEDPAEPPTPSVPETEPTDDRAPEHSSPKTKTIKQRHAADPPPRKDPTKVLTREEREARALKVQEKHLRTS